jgi:hypothetical protein
VITYCCFYISLYIGQLIEKRRYERKVAKKLLQNYQVDLSDRATNVKKRILSEDAILDMISASKKKTMMSLDSLKSSQRLLQLTRKVRIYIIMLFVKKLPYLFLYFIYFCLFNRMENIFVRNYVNVLQENKFNDYEMKSKRHVNVMISVFE